MYGNNYSLQTKPSLRCNRDSLSIRGEYGDVGGTRVRRRVVVGVVVRDVVGVVVINNQFNTGCIRLTKREEIKN